MEAGPEHERREPGKPKMLPDACAGPHRREIEGQGQTRDPGDTADPLQAPFGVHCLDDALEAQVLSLAHPVLQADIVSRRASGLGATVKAAFGSPSRMIGKVCEHIPDVSHRRRDRSLTPQIEHSGSP